MISLIWAAAGIFGAAALKQQQEKNAALASPAGALTKPGAATGMAPANSAASPGTTYPFSVPQAPRMDNKNQPWTQQNPGQLLQNVGDLSSGLSNLWDSLGVGDWLSSSSLGSDLGQSSTDIAAAANDDSMLDDIGWTDDYGFNYSDSSSATDYTTSDLA